VARLRDPNGGYLGDGSPDASREFPYLASPGSATLALVEA